MSSSPQKAQPLPAGGAIRVAPSALDLACAQMRAAATLVRDSPPGAVAGSAGAAIGDPACTEAFTAAVRALTETVWLAASGLDDLAGVLAAGAVTYRLADASAVGPVASGPGR